MSAALKQTPVSSLASQPALLEIRNIAHSFGGMVVLRDVCFSVAQGKITGLIGPNGSGKTTLFNIASGFLRPKAGDLLLNTQTITSCSVQQRSCLGLVRTFQTPKVFQHMSVRENIEMGFYASTRAGFISTMFATPAARRERLEMREKAEKTATKFDITHLLDMTAGELPAGQQRIVEIARAYMNAPSLLMLDEPSSGLSSDEVRLLRQWIETLSAEGITILLVSHDMGLMSVCHDVHALYFGKIIASGSMSAIQADPTVREAYLGG